MRRWPALLATPLLLPVVRHALDRDGLAATCDRLGRWSQQPARAASAADARAVAAVVARVAGRRPFRALCLTRSLVLWFLLRRQGIDARLVIGAGPPGPDSSLPAHAWVEYSGEPVNDALDIGARFGAFDLQLPGLATAAADRA